MRSEWERDAQRCANGLLHRFGVRDATHIRVESFAAKLGAEIIEAPLDGASAQLIHNGKRAVIMVSDRIVDPLARRFSIAHELGHFVMRHPSRPASELCTPYASRLKRAGARDYEAEANAFAAELLMPTTLVRMSVSTLVDGVMGAVVDGSRSRSRARLGLTGWESGISA